MCRCSKRKDVVLDCGHLLCIGCTAKLKRDIALNNFSVGGPTCYECTTKFKTSIFRTQ